MSTSKGSVVCAAKKCPNKRRNCKLSFFHFPKEHKRADIWLIACGREDLRERMSKLCNYRLCSAHFKEDMYANDLRNRLLPTAMPSIFISMEDLSSVAREHNYCIRVNQGF